MYIFTTPQYKCDRCGRQEDAFDNSTNSGYPETDWLPPKDWSQHHWPDCRYPEKGHQCFACLAGKKNFNKDEIPSFKKGDKVRLKVSTVQKGPWPYLHSLTGTIQANKHIGTIFRQHTDCQCNPLNSKEGGSYMVTFKDIIITGANGKKDTSDLSVNVFGRGLNLV